jgi:hypothetical protein
MHLVKSVESDEEFEDEEITEVNIDEAEVISVQVVQDGEDISNQQSNVIKVKNCVYFNIRAGRLLTMFFLF